MTTETAGADAGPEESVNDLDGQLVGEFVERVVRTVTGAATTAMMLLGDRLGLYAAMARAGAVTPAALGGATRTHERYVREWLAQQAAAGIVDYDADDGTFSLPAAHAAVLADDDSPASMAGVAPLLLGMFRGADRIVDAFRTGRGVGWGEQDPAIFESTDRFFRVGYRNHLVNDWMPRLHGIAERLAAGGRAVDVGCGYGAALLLLARAFPAATLLGCDPHRQSIETARARATAAGVSDRVRFEVADATSYPADGYDLVCYFATLHDLGDPVGAAAYARTALSPGGSLMLVEPIAGDDLGANLMTNPGAALSYAASTFLCTPNSLAEPVALALGAQAGESRLRTVLEEAGYGSVRRIADDPMNMVIEARP